MQVGYGRGTGGIPLSLSVEGGSGEGAVFLPDFFNL